MTTLKKSSYKFKLGVYQHYKGNKYLAIDVAKHNETLEELVCYIPLYADRESKIWIRFLAMCMEKVEIDGVQKP